MKKFISMIALAVLSGSAIAAPDGCEDAVDMADDLDFAKMHVECAEEPVTLYDPKSKANFLSKRKPVVTAYADPATTATIPVKAGAAEIIQSNAKQAESTLEQSVKELVQDGAAHNAGVTFNIREPFTITGGPQSALNGLYVQMANYCPAGWEKLKEWSEPNQSGYYLHYQFQCAE